MVTSAQTPHPPGRTQSVTRERVDAICRREIYSLYEGHPYHSDLERGVGDRSWYYLSVLMRAGVVFPSARICDLGSGLSWFPALLHYLGSDVTVIDRFEGGGGVDKNEKPAAQTIIDRLQIIGISVFNQNLHVVGRKASG